MGFITKLEYLPVTAGNIEIRDFFRDFVIPEGGVRVIGGEKGVAFILFEKIQEARSALKLSMSCIQGKPVQLNCSSYEEMRKVTEEARAKTLALLSSNLSSSLDRNPLDTSGTSMPMPLSQMQIQASPYCTMSNNPQNRSNYQALPNISNNKVDDFNKRNLTHNRKFSQPKVKVDNSQIQQRTNSFEIGTQHGKLKGRRRRSSRNRKDKDSYNRRRSGFRQDAVGVDISPKTPNGGKQSRLNCCVLISGAPPRADERNVFDFFCEMGINPISIQNMYDGQELDEGQIVCEFSDPNQAKRALTKNGAVFSRTPVQVSWMPSRTNKTNKRFRNY